MISKLLLETLAVPLQRMRTISTGTSTIFICMQPSTVISTINMVLTWVATVGLLIDAGKDLKATMIQQTDRVGRQNEMTVA